MRTLEDIMIHLENIMIHIGGYHEYIGGLGVVQLTGELIDKRHLFYILKPLMP